MRYIRAAPSADPLCVSLSLSLSLVFCCLPGLRTSTRSLTAQAEHIIVPHQFNPHTFCRREDPVTAERCRLPSSVRRMAMHQQHGSCTKAFEEAVAYAGGACTLHRRHEGVRPWWW